jgi:hypothetical protein
LAQKLGQLQTFAAVFPQERRVNLHLLGRPTTFLARVTSSRAHTSLACKSVVHPERSPLLTTMIAGEAPVFRNFD